MPGPKTAEAALEWIRDAIEHDRVIRIRHFEEQCEDRRYNPERHPHRIVETAVRCVFYPPGRNHAGGTSWRVYSLSTRGDKAGLGFEAFRDGNWAWVTLVTLLLEW
jgi:hypothetical protein